MTPRISTARINELSTARAHIRARIPAEHTIEHIVSPSYWSPLANRLEKVPSVNIECVHEALEFEALLRVRKVTNAQVDLVVLRLEDPMSPEEAVAEWHRRRKASEPELPETITIHWSPELKHHVRHRGDVARVKNEPLAHFMTRSDAIRIAVAYAKTMGETDVDDTAGGDEPGADGDEAAASAGRGAEQRRAPRRRGRVGSNG